MSRRVGIRWVVSVALVAAGVAVPATAAFALRHHHRHHHHHGTPSSGSSTDGPISVTPGTAILTTNGGFAATLFGDGLPPGMPVVIDADSLTVACTGSVTTTTFVDGEGALISVSGTRRSVSVTPSDEEIPIVDPSNPTSDGGGRISARLQSPGPCVPGTYPIIVTEQATPFQTFVVFITLKY